MALIHTVALSNERKNLAGTVSATRTSASRRYAACIVATATADTVRADEVRIASRRADLDEARAALSEAMRRTGLTVEQARTEHERLTALWFRGDDGLFATERRLHREAGAAIGQAWAPIPMKAAERDLLARGLVSPYMGASYAVVEAARGVDTHEHWLAHHDPVTLGQQSVVTWCGSVALAQKALGGREAKLLASRGYSLEIRTDIEVRETGKRAAR